MLSRLGDLGKNPGEELEDVEVSGVRSAKYRCAALMVFSPDLRSTGRTAQIHNEGGSRSFLEPSFAAVKCLKRSHHIQVTGSHKLHRPGPGGTR